MGEKPPPPPEGAASTGTPFLMGGRLYLRIRRILGDARCMLGDT